MREIRTHGSEGRESDLNRTSLPLSVINGRWPMLDCKVSIFKTHALGWCLAGCVQYQRDGIQTPEVVSAASSKYRIDSDFIANSIEEKCYPSHPP